VELVPVVIPPVVTLIVTVEFENVVPVGDTTPVDVLTELETLIIPCCIKQISLKAFSALFASVLSPQLRWAQANISLKPAKKLEPRASPVHTQP